MLNDMSRGFFKPSRGPSFSLFILTQQVLSCMLENEFIEDIIDNFGLPQECIIISHIFYADDILIFANGDKRFGRL